jgi:three-Cys-motif partner protein
LGRLWYIRSGEKDVYKAALTESSILPIKFWQQKGYEMNHENVKSHKFGGAWTDAKLKVLDDYLKSYVKVLKGNNFRLGYIDAFAGTGYRDSHGNDTKNLDLFFPDLAEADSQELLDGSARIALKVVPGFDKYIFIEKCAERCSELEKLKTDFPDKANNIEVRHGEGNKEIQNLCRKNWAECRAVLFLDPYGMQVEWTTIENIAKTKAIDLWLLFPLGIGVNRLLMKSGDIPDPWRERLNILLGTDEWYKEFYNITTGKDLFGNDVVQIEKASMETIGRYFVKRLKTIFPGVSENPGVLKNRVNNPLYLLCFAVGNEKGKNVALRIANHLLEGME